MYEKLVNRLEAAGATYRVLDHAPEGSTDQVSLLRGNELAQAAKCIIIRVKVDKKTSKFVLAVVPGDRKVDLAAVKGLYDARYASFAELDVAEQLAGSVSGTVLPLTFTDELDLVVDPDLLVHKEIFFNAALLDRSLALDTQDYLTVANPRVAVIAQPPA